MDRESVRLTAGRAVGKSFSMMGRHFGAAFSIALLLIGLPALITAVMTYASMDDMLSWMRAMLESGYYGLGGYGGDALWIPGMDSLGAFAASSSLGYLVSLASAIVFTPMASAALVIVFSRSLISKDTDFTFAMRFAVKRLGRLAVLSLAWIAFSFALMVGLLVVGLVFALVMAVFMGLMVAVSGVLEGLFAALITLVLLAAVVGIACIFTMAHSLSYAIAMNENKWHFNAILRGFSMALKRFWSMLGAHVLIGLCVFGAALIPAVAIGVSAMLGVGGGSIAIWSILSVAVTLFAIILMMALSVQYYFSIRGEFEGWQPADPDTEARQEAGADRPEIPGPREGGGDGAPEA